MKYFVRLRIWRDCPARFTQTFCVTIDENPQDYLERQEKRLGNFYTSASIDFACQVGDGSGVSKDPTWQECDPVPLTPEQIHKQNVAAAWFCGAAAAIILFAVGIHYVL